MTLEDIYASADCGQCACVNYFIELSLDAPANDPDCTIKAGNAKCEGVVPDLMQLGNTTFNATVGFNETSFSRVVLDNSCGEYDETLCECFWRGRDAKLYVGLPDWDCSEYLTAFCGTISANPSANNNTISVGITGLPAALQTPIGNTYDNGDPIPLTFGCVSNMQPYLVDGGNLIFQVNDGPVSDVPAVYDNGSPLTFGGYVTNIQTANPAPGSYVADLQTGLIKLGAPFDGPITADVKGLSTDTAGIIQDVLTIVGEGANINAASLADFAAAFPYDIGIALTGSETAQEVINSLVQGAYGWWGVGRNCQYEFGAYRTPLEGDDCDYTITEKDIEAGKINKLENPQSHSEIYLRHQRNWTVLTNPAAITQTNGTYNYFTNQYRNAIIDIPAAFGAYGQSSVEILTYLANEFDAQVVGAELSDTLSGRRECIKISLMCGALEYERGKTVCVESDRFCANKKPWYIESVVENVATMQATLTLCRTCPIDPPCFLEASVEPCECDIVTLTSGQVSQFCACFTLSAVGLPPMVADYQITINAVAPNGSITQGVRNVAGLVTTTAYPGVASVSEFAGGPADVGTVEYCIDVDPGNGETGYIEFVGTVIVIDSNGCEPVEIEVNHRCEFQGVLNQTPVAPDDIEIIDCEVGEPFNWTSPAFIDPEGQPITITETGTPAGLTFTDNLDGTATISGTAPSGGPFVVTLTGSDGNSSSSFTVTIDCVEVLTTGVIAGNCNANSLLGGPIVEFCGVGINTGNSTSEQICGLPIARLDSRTVGGTPQSITLVLAGASSQSDFDTITIGGVTLNSAGASYTNGVWTWGYPGALTQAEFNAIRAELSGNFTVDYVC